MLRFVQFQYAMFCPVSICYVLSSFNMLCFVQFQYAMFVPASICHVLSRFKADVYIFTLINPFQNLRQESLQGVCNSPEVLVS